ncbi:MAG: 1,4-alpha-glucan branching protein domain-containing protein [Thermoplasmata archaeon]
MTTGGRFLDAHFPKVIVTLPESSWGQGGHHFIWYNPEVEWFWPKIYECEDKMSALADKYDGEKDLLKRRILNQAGRELLLLESSDWPFLISTGQAKQYSAQRFNEHVARFYECIDLLKNLEESRNDEGTKKEEINSKLEKIEQIDNLFPNIQFEYFKTYEYGPKK